METSAADLARIDYEATLDCVHCGLCLSHCPTYRETGCETSSPRGRIYLMRGVAESRISLDPRVAEEMYFCLACRACESACPAGVCYGHLVDGVRVEIERHGARPWARRVLERLLLRRVVGSTRMLRMLFGALRFYQRRGLQGLLRRSGVLRLAPGLERAERMLPPLPEPFRPPPVAPPQGVRRGRVALFSGCIMPEVFGPVNAATLEVLTRNGFEVLTPEEQCCCGALHLHAGDSDGAERLLRRNRAGFQGDDVDAIILNSAGCGAFLKEYGGEIAGKVRDISEFLHDVGLRPPLRPLRLRVAYDDPCHLLHGQRISHAPRALLRTIPGLDLLDLPGTDECCGGAGVYNLTHSQMSEQLAAHKVAAIREIAPDAVATGNPSCLVQIGAAVREAGLPVEVLHPVELLNRAYD